MLGEDETCGVTVGWMVGKEKMVGIEEIKELRGWEIFI